MLDKYEIAQLSACCEELRTIRTPKDFYRIVCACNQKYGVDIANLAREITKTYNSAQYKEA